MQEISVINAGAATASVPANPGRVLALEHSGAFAYTHDERTAIDAANEAFSPVIDAAVDQYEKILTVGFTAASGECAPCGIGR